MYLRHTLFIIIIFVITACNNSSPSSISRLTIGVVDYGENDKSLQRYDDFQDYLATKQGSLIELEPTYNEVRALEQISRNKWDLVFAPPGLAAIAISRYNYQPLVPLEGQDRTRSVIVALQKSTFEKRQDLRGQSIALGQKGSATGYYLPIFNLYGVNFKEVVYASTPEEILQLIDEDRVTVGALSLADFNVLKREYPANRFKTVYLDKHNVPPGAILISDRLERNQQEQIKLALEETPSFIAATAGYLPSEKLPNYDYLIKTIERVKEVLAESPMVLQ